MPDVKTPPDTPEWVQYEHTWQLISGQPWAMEESVCLKLRDIIEQRMRGERLSESELSERLGQTVAPYAGPVVQTLQVGELQGRGPRIVNGVAVLPLQGMLAPRLNIFQRFSGGTSTQEFGNWYLQAVKNPDVKAIVFDVDSPGGMGAGNQELIDLIAQHPAGKPVKAVCTGLCASAAYYVASVAEELIASPSTLVGSVGTAIVYEENSKAMAQAGRSVEIIRAGTNKLVPSGNEPLTDQSRQLLQERADQMNELFLSAVAKHRKVSVQTVQEKFGQGKVFLAAQAKEVGMIDRVGTLAQVVSELAGTAPLGGGSQKISSPQEGTQMNPQIFAALVQRQLIQQTASPETAEMALNIFFQATGQPKPTDEAAIIAMLLDSVGKQRDLPPGGQQTGNTGTGTSTGTGSSTGTVSPEALASGAAREATQAERVRVKELQVRGGLIGIQADQIQQAVESGLSLEQALLKWTEQMTAQNAPVTKPALVASSEDKFAQAASLMLCEQIGMNGQLTAEERSLMAGIGNRSVMDLARKTLQFGTGQRSLPDDDEEVAKMALRSAGETTMINGVAVQSEGGWNRPGDFPNLLSNVQGRMLMQIDQYTGATYREWAHKLADVPDFKPKTLLKTGEFGELPVIQDGEAPEEGTFREEPSFIAVDRFGMAIKMTPIMLINNDLQSWSDAFMDTLVAADLTLNRMLINLLTGNVVLPDGFALFDDTNHGNHVDSGAVPGTTTLAAMRTRIRKQKGVSNKRNMNYKFQLLLHPTDLDTDMEKLLRVDLNVQSANETNPDIFRGRIRSVSDPMLDDYSAKKYYGFAEPRMARSLVYAKMRGYSRPRITSYWDPKTECRYHKIEDRFGAAVNNYRGVVLNDGE